MYSRQSKYRARAKFQRRIALVSLSLIVVLYTLFTQFLSDADADNKRQVAYQQVTVQSGDSLWRIADKYCVNQNVQVYIEQIKQLNGLNSSLVQAGQQLVVPLY